MAAPPSFDRGLFDEAVLYIAYRMRDDPRFGRVKVAKTLFYADFTAFAEDGRALTGARYVHYPKGPFTKELYRAEERLVGRGVATLKEPEHEHDEAKLWTERFTPDLTAAWHRAFLDIKMDEVASEGTARAVSKKSHDHPGWEFTEEGEEIPYESQFISRQKPPDRAVEVGRRLAREHGWPV